MQMETDRLRPGNKSGDNGRSGRRSNECEPRPRLLGPRSPVNSDKEPYKGKGKENRRGLGQFEPVRCRIAKQESGRKLEFFP